MKWKPSFQKLSSKVVGASVAIIVVFLILALVETRQLGEVRTSVVAARNNTSALQDIKDVTAASGDQMQAVYKYILEGGAPEIDTFIAAGERRDAALVAALAQAEKQQERVYFEALRNTADYFDDTVLNKLVPAWQSGERDKVKLFEKQAAAARASIENTAASITSSFDERNIQAREAAERASAQARSYLMLAALAGISLSLFVTTITYRRLSRPVRELRDASLAMTKGDMERRVRVTTDDEVGELGNTFNLMAAAVQGKIEQLTNLSEIALAISSELDWSRVLEVIMDKGIELTGSDAAAIVLYDEQQGSFKDVYSRGLSDKFTGRMRFGRGGLAERVVFGDQAVRSDDLLAHYGMSKMARDEGITAFICLPLKVRQRKLGVFYVYSRKSETYGREELAVLTILSNQAAIAIHNAMMFERSQEKAMTDGLTGLYNQRHFYMRLHEEVERAGRNNKPLSIIFCDLDRFKAFNDSNGHALGDLALKETGRIISESKRSIDIAARYGGEEFAVILPDTDSGGAQIIAHRIRRRIAALEFAGAAGGAGLLTASLGVASYPADAAGTRELVDKADWSMYYSKRHGRDMVTLFHDAAADYDRLSLKDLVREEFHMVAAQALAVSLASRDSYDGDHSQSVARLASTLAKALSLADEEVQQVRVAGLLHDIGLVSVPFDVINKNEELSEEDWYLIREHPEVGTDILKHISSLQGFLPVVRHHHEHYNGAGYPDGLKQDEIPLGARIIAVADAYQAMISNRPYRPAMTPRQALAELQKGAGAQFDPLVVDLFTRMMGSHEARAS